MARREIVKACLPLLSLLRFLLLALVVQGRSPHRVDFKRPRLYPESFDWDPWHSHFVVGSISLGVVLSVSDAGVVGDLVADPGYAGRAAVLGVRVDARRRRILVTVDGAENLTALAAYSLDTGKRLFLTPLLTPDTDTNTNPAAAANDLAIDPDGNAYVTNSRSNFLWKVTSNGSASSLRNPLFTSQKTVETSTAPTQSLIAQLDALCGLNGIAYLHGGFLLIGQTNSGKLFRVNLRDLDDIRVIHLNKPLVGIDGIAIRRDGALIAVSSHTAWLIRSRDNWISAEISDELPLNVSSFTTAVAFRENDRPYVLHSYVMDLIQGTADQEMFTLEEIAFPSDKDEAWWLLIPIVGFVILVSVWRFQVNSLVKQMRKKRE